MSQLPWETNMTTVVHREEYDAIAPTRPELSQAGRTVLITGGSAGIGLGIAKAFIRASAAMIIIVARRPDTLTKAVGILQQLVAETGSKAIILGEVCDSGDGPAIEKLWWSLREKNVIVDVLVLNAAKFTQPKPLLELGVEELMAEFQTNVHGPFVMAERFSKQVENERQKFIINVATMSINTFYDWQQPLASARPGYGLTKNAGTLMAQLVAKDVSPEKMQVISFNPGTVFTEAWSDTGLTSESLPFDDVSLPGAFAVWLASAEAAFLHGRFVWASWDVDELAKGEIRKRLDDDGNFLRLGVIGLNGVMKA